MVPPGRRCFCEAQSRIRALSGPTASTMNSRPGAIWGKSRMRKVATSSRVISGPVCGAMGGSLLLSRLNHGTRPATMRHRANRGSSAT